MIYNISTEVFCSFIYIIYIQDYSNYLPGLTLTYFMHLFYAKVKFGHIGFCMGKSENYRICLTIERAQI